MTQDLVLQTLRSFAARIGQTYDSTEMSYELCDGIARALGTTGAGVSVVDGDERLSFTTATDERTIAIERV